MASMITHRVFFTEPVSGTETAPRSSGERRARKGKSVQKTFRSIQMKTEIVRKDVNVMQIS